MNNKKKDVVWNTIGVTLNSFTSVFFLIVVNRINGSNAGGIFSFSYSVACLLFIIGIYATRTYQIADVNGKLNDSEYLAHKCITCIIMLICAGIYCMFIIDGVKRYALFTITCFKLIEAFSDTLYGFIQKDDKLYVVGISLTFKAICQVVIFTIVDCITKNMLIAILSMLTISILFTATYDMHHVKKIVKREKVHALKIKFLFKEGFPIFLISFLAVYIVNATKYSMNSLLDNSSQAIFGIIIMPASFISLCGQYIMNPVLNELVYCYNDGNYYLLKSKVLKIIGILFGIWGISEILAYFCGIPVLQIMYGIDISSYKWSLLIIIFGAIFYASSIIFQNCLIIMQKNRCQVLIYIFSSIIACVSSIVCIRKSEINGAAYAYFITMFLHAVIYYVYFNYEIKILEKKEKERK